MTDKGKSSKQHYEEVISQSNDNKKAAFRWLMSKPRKEDKNWLSLDEIRENNDKRWLKTYGCMLVIITVVFTFLFLAALFVWSWHYIAPKSLTWLCPSQLSKIQSVLFSGGMGAIISGIIREQLGKTK
ncbi:hypothetical protein KRX19_05635 [Cardiobacteriaceae bacterium TAE3-ERU3]|nr:hypothetical protein [Cardiobacteriaceae bacterium TAE3-ERU3]